MAYIELSKEAYFHNLSLLSQRLGSIGKLAVVLKDNAYGHGLLEMATLAKEFGVTKAVVRTHEEARAIQGLFSFILILVPDETQDTEDFSLVINSLSQLSKTAENSKIHLKIDSGMHRSGISQDEIEKAFMMIEKQALHLEGVMTHFRSADELSCELFWQMKAWEDIKKKTLALADARGWERPLFHAGASATLLRQSAYHDDFARCGIATYGYEEFHPSFGAFALKPVLTLWAEKISSRHYKKGMRVGYGGVGELSHDSTISTYDIGYADGYFRYKGDGTLTTADGAKIVGRVSMDNISIESEAAQVALIKDAKTLAHYHDTISYDVLAKLSGRIKRGVI